MPKRLLDRPISPALIRQADRFLPGLLLALGLTAVGFLAGRVL